MTRRTSSRALLAVACFTAAGVAHAEPPAAAPPATPAAEASFPASDAPVSCETSYELAQTERLAAHYISASAAALACSQIQCNPAIVKECVRLYEALEEDTPTLVFAARKAEGGELIDVRVEIDGKLAADHISGRPFKADPGPHHFSFISKERGRLETTESARVGDHARVVEVTFADPNAKPAGAAPLVAADQPPPEPHSHPVPVATWVLGGVGIAGLASFTIFRVSGVGDYNHYNSTCSPYCDPNDVDKVRTKFTISYVSLGIGAASLAGAGIIFALSRTDHGSHTEASITSTGDGAMARLRTHF